MPFDYSRLWDDLFESGGKIVPFNNRPPAALVDWAEAEGVVVAPGASSSTILRQIATARGVAFLASDTDYKVLGKIAVSPEAPGVWEYAREIGPLAPEESLTAPTLIPLGLTVQWPSSADVPDFLYLEGSEDQVTWIPQATVPNPNFVLASVVTKGKYYRAKYTKASDVSNWSATVFLPV